MNDLALLVLEDGTVFEGEALGAVGVTTGEAVFTTGMTGYQETLTDPSYHRQIVVQTAVHIGNTGMNDEDGESEKIWVAGYVMKERPRAASSWRSKRELVDELERSSIVGICEVDTRAITMRLREVGAMRAGIFSGSAATSPLNELLAQVRESPQMIGSSLTEEVSSEEMRRIPANIVGDELDLGLRVAALDLGIKQGITDQLTERGVEVVVLPADTSLTQILELGANGVLLSNGPGDPAAADQMVETVKTLLEKRVPLFGVCFGNQLLGRALGLETYKLLYGHRGLNLPVQDTFTKKVEITAHNHGFAVAAPIGESFDTEFGKARVSHICLNDSVVEGLECLQVPAFSVQYHPEANAGPHDSAHLFDRFVASMSVK